MRGGLRQARLVALAIASLVIAYIVISFAGGIFFGALASGPPGLLASIVLGGLVFRDIVSRERTKTLQR